MSAVSAMDAALYTALNTATVVGVGKASGVYRGMAPLTATFPLVIFALMDGDSPNVIGSGTLRDPGNTYDLPQQIVSGNIISFEAGQLALSLD